MAPLQEPLTSCFAVARARAGAVAGSWASAACHETPSLFVFFLDFSLFSLLLHLRKRGGRLQMETPARIKAYYARPITIDNHRIQLDGEEDKRKERVRACF